jgi:hypothetical protein
MKSTSLNLELYAQSQGRWLWMRIQDNEWKLKFLTIQRMLMHN